MGIVYCIVCLTSGKKYVGITTRTLEIRWKEHASNSITKPKFLLGRAIQKYGCDNFVRGVIETCETIEELCEREKFWIKKLQTNSTLGHWGYNMDDGGKVHICSAQERKTIAYKASIRNKGRKLTPEWKKKIGLGQAGKINSVETRQKMSKSKSHIKKPVLQFHLPTRTIRYFPSTKEAERFIKQNGFPCGCKNGIRDSIKFKVVRYDSYWIRLI